MPSVCCYFQVHQPWRLRQFSFFDDSADFLYFDDVENKRILKRVAEKCYLPANERLLRLIRKHRGSFNCSFSITGTFLDQAERWAPKLIESFRDLVDTGCVELLAETYHHSLASVYSAPEFVRQVEKHRNAIRRVFDVDPTAFRNTELIFSDEIGKLAASLGFEAVVAEGADDILGWRSPNFVYTSAGMGLLAKNYRLSDDVAFRFSDTNWAEHPLSADKYASWIHRVSGQGDVVNLFMDYETFGEHQWGSTGIFEFLDHFPTAVLRHPDWDFCTPSEAIARYPRRAELSYPRLTSWADADRDLSAWSGNRIQQRCLLDVYSLEDAVLSTEDQDLIETWRRLLTSDHFYYMSTKTLADGDVHAYFSPYGSPYMAFINYQNVLRNLRALLGRGHEIGSQELADALDVHPEIAESDLVRA